MSPKCLHGNFPSLTRGAIQAKLNGLSHKSHAEPEPCVSQSLTTSSEQSYACGNPFCKAIIEPLPEGYRRTARRYCSDRCKLDCYALRRVAAIISQVGLVRFYDRLDQA